MDAPRRLWVRLPRSVVALLFFLAFGVGGLILGCILFPPLELFGARRAMRALVRASYRLFVGAGRVTGLFRVILSQIIQGADTYMPTPQPYSMPGRSAFDNRCSGSVPSFP